MFIGYIIGFSNRFFKFFIPYYIPIILLIPLIVDGVTQMFEIRESNNLLRFCTGLSFGCGVVLFFGGLDAP